MARLTQAEYENFYEYYSQQPQQTSGVCIQYDLLAQRCPDMLDPDKPDGKWILKYREKPPAPAVSNPLDVVYYSQLDNYTDPNGTCYSSANAMMLKYLKPAAIDSDDAYLARVLSFGKSTDPNAQIKALATYGVTASFVNNYSKQKLIDNLKKGIPTPCGFLHHGTPQNPTGGGHWLCVIGYYDGGFIVNDPYGECNLSNGQYGSKNGAKLKYSHANWTDTRWSVASANDGWSIVATKW
jgi:uncharacterized protein YvpB